ncbi:unnamed protein product [Sphagnum tenellum]
MPELLTLDHPDVPRDPVTVHPVVKEAGPADPHVAIPVRQPEQGVCVIRNADLLSQQPGSLGREEVRGGQDVVSVYGDGVHVGVPGEAEDVEVGEVEAVERLAEVLGGEDLGDVLVGGEHFVFVLY